MNLRIATRDSLAAAIVLFEEAVALDPRYASAWARIGLAYSLQGQFLSLPALLGKAERGAGAGARDRPRERVRAVRPRLVCGWPRAATTRRSALRRAPIDLDPTNLAARSTLARAFWVGKGLIEEGIGALERAGAHNPDAGYVLPQLALLRGLERRPDRAEIEARARRRAAGGVEVGHRGAAHGRQPRAAGLCPVPAGALRRARWRSSSASRRSWPSTITRSRARCKSRSGQKLGAACWRKGDREAARSGLRRDDARHSGPASRAVPTIRTRSTTWRRCTRCAAKPPTRCASWPTAWQSAGTDPGPGPPRPRFRGAAGQSGVPRPGRRRRRPRWVRAVQAPAS